MAKLEIACFNLESALIAQQGGADRVELCHDITDGGITPSYGTVATARKLLHVQFFVMIRPRIGNYVYAGAEIGQIKKDILEFKKMNVDGLVFGVLDSEGNVDVPVNRELVQLAAPLPCTFHRASDQMKDPLKALEDIIACGFQTVLTSGQKRTAVEGLSLIKQLKDIGAGRIRIMPGGGVRSSNLELLKRELNVDFYHSSAILKDDVADLNEVRALKLHCN